MEGFGQRTRSDSPAGSTAVCLRRRRFAPAHPPLARREAPAKPSPTEATRRLPARDPLELDATRRSAAVEISTRHVVHADKLGTGGRRGGPQRLGDRVAVGACSEADDERQAAGKGGVPAGIQATRRGARPAQGLERRVAGGRRWCSIRRCSCCVLSPDSFSSFCAGHRAWKRVPVLALGPLGRQQRDCALQSALAPAPLALALPHGRDQCRRRRRSPRS